MSDTKPHDDAHAAAGHDDHGHGDGHGERNFDIIPESSSADAILNLVSWLAVIVLLVFSMIMVNAHLHESEAASNEAPHAAPAR